MPSSFINPWVSWTARSYEQIKASVVARLQANVPEVTDYSETNILIIILSIFAGIGEMINYYIDNMAREAYIATARRLVSMINLVKILDYRVKAAFPASADITITFSTLTVSPIFVPSGSIFQSPNGISYISLVDLTIPTGTLSIGIGVLQITPVVDSIIGTTDGTPNQVISLGQDYANGSISITINGILYNNVDSFAYLGPEDYGYIVEVDATATAFIIFGDGINGKIPPMSQNIFATYNTTQGAAGNVVANTIQVNSSIPGTPSVTNPLAASGGADYQGIESIRKLAPLSIRTLYRAVTRQDYIDIALMADGVAKAGVKYCCGKKIDIYIGPDGGGIASSILLNSTKEYMETKKMITTKLNLNAAGVTYLIISMDVTAAFRILPSAAEADVRAALEAEWSYDNQDMDEAVRISDLYRIVDSLPKVDHLKLTDLRTIPYADPIVNENPLVWSAESQPGATEIIKWQIYYNGSIFFIYRASELLGTIGLEVEFTDDDNNLTFTLHNGFYTANDRWEFYTYPYMQDIELNDFTVPVIIDSHLILNVTGLSAVNCNDNC